MRILDTVHHLQVGLDYHMQRHNLLTSNLAQVDTPNYKPVDLQRTPAFEKVLGATLSATHEGHFGIAQKPELGKVIEDPGASPGGDGNGVSLEREAVKIAANNVRYDVIANLVSNELSTLGWAANDGRNG